MLRILAIPALLLAFAFTAAPASADGCTTPTSPVQACYGTSDGGCAAWARGDFVSACVPDCSGMGACQTAPCGDGIGLRWDGQCEEYVDGEWSLESCEDDFSYRLRTGDYYNFGCSPGVAVHECEGTLRYGVEIGGAHSGYC